MIVGFYHPALKICGGAEWVAINLINIIKSEGHKTVVLTNEKINNERVKKKYLVLKYISIQT